MLHSLYKQFYITSLSFREGFSSFKHLQKKQQFPATHTPTATLENDLLGVKLRWQGSCTGDFLLVTANDLSGDSKECQQVRMVSANQEEVWVDCRL